MFLFATKYSQDGNLIKRIPIKTMLKDTIGNYEGIASYKYEPHQVIPDGFGNLILLYDYIRHCDNSNK